MGEFSKSFEDAANISTREPIRNLDITLKAVVDKIFQDSGMKDLAVAGSNDYEHFKEIQEKFFEAIGDIPKILNL